jgi:uncharacterized protein (TIGR00251 family)
MAGTRLLLRVSPGASRAEVVGRHGDAWKIRVPAPPERGRANDAVVTLLAATLAVDRRDVTLVSGHGSRDKIVEIGGLAADETERRMTERGRGRLRGTRKRVPTGGAR